MDNFMDKLAVKYTASEMIKANAQAEMMEMQGLQEQVEAYEAVLQEMRKLNYKNTELTEKMYSLVDESIEKVRNLQIEASESGADKALISKEMTDAVVGAVSEAISNMDETVANAVAQTLQNNNLQNPAPQVDNSEVLSVLSALSLAQEANSAMLNSMTNKISESLSQSQGGSDNVAELSEVVNNSLSSTNAMVAEIKESLANLDEHVGRLDEALIETNMAVRVANESLNRINDEGVTAKGEFESSSSDNTDAILQAVSPLNDNISNVYTAVGSVDESVNTVNTAVSMMGESIAAAIAQVNDNINEKASIIASNTTAPASGESEELKNSVAEMAAGIDEVRGDIRILKASQDESKNTIKSSLDSAVYGLKQDNREVVEFIQRMNTNLMSITNDPDKERKEEEARAREEEQRKFLEERFKSAEDFMHKESVKVYRNVQAVVNEKTDNQSDNVETQIKRVNAQVSQLKLIVIIAAVLSGADLVVQLLKIFGIL